MTQRNIKWVTFHQHLQDLMRDIYENARDTDCVVKVEGKEIYVHRAVLANASEYFSFLIKTAPVFETPTFIIADYDYNLIRDIIVFIYTGELFVDNDRYEEFKDACMNLGLKSFERKRPLEQGTTGNASLSKKKARNVRKETNPLVFEEVHVDEIALPEFKENDEDEEEEKPVKRKRSNERTYDDLDLACAIRETEGGVSVAEVAKKYNIPKNTLYSKVKSPEFKKEKLEIVEKAITDILDNGISIRQAAQKYSLSKTNLWVHFKLYKEKHPEVRYTSSSLRENKKPNRTIQKLKRNLQAQPATTLEALRNKANEFKIQLQNAISDCKNGASLTEVSEKYKIPEDTIYRNVKNMNLPHIDCIADTESTEVVSKEEYLETDEWWKPSQD